MKAIIQKVKELSISQSNEKAYKELYQRTRTKHKTPRSMGAATSYTVLLRNYTGLVCILTFNFFLFLQGKKGKKGKKGKLT